LKEYLVDGRPVERSGDMTDGRTTNW
jgi:hypothetical protein